MRCMSMSRRSLRVRNTLLSIGHHMGLILLLSLSEPLPNPLKFTRREGEPERHAAKRKNADIQAEYNAMTCVALYILLMGFSQKGIDKLRNHYEHMQMRDPDGEMEVSEGIDEGEPLFSASGVSSGRSRWFEALTWFKDHFIKCHDRAVLVKTWLPAQYSGPPTFLDQLVYDRALLLVRNSQLLFSDSSTESDWCRSHRVGQPRERSC